MNFTNHVKDVLFEKIGELSVGKEQFVKNPGKDFPRERKLTFSTMIHTVVSMGTEAIRDELLKTFKFYEDTATSSAFIQQRNKIDYRAFEYLFHSFNDSFERVKKYKGYYLLAVDGSKITYQPNPADEENYFQNKENAKGFCQLHLNALYNLLSRRYVEVTIDPGRSFNENKAFYDFIDHYERNEKAIFIADRNYEAYNSFAHCIENKQKFVIRVRDAKNASILSSLKLPDSEEFDTDVTLKLKRKQTKETKKDKSYKFLPKNSTFDYLDDKDYYVITFRVVRFKLKDNSYECIITNLDKKEFSVDEIKELYHMRWGIETSFRELKYSTGMLAFHSKKVEFVKQEIFARLLLYNFCELITSRVVVTKKDRKYEYQLNFTRAIHICKHFISVITESPPDVEALISKELLPVRPGRKDPRKVKPTSPVSFIYRF